MIEDDYRKTLEDFKEAMNSLAYVLYKELRESGSIPTKLAEGNPEAIKHEKLYQLEKQLKELDDGSDKL